MRSRKIKKNNRQEVRTYDQMDGRALRHQGNEEVDAEAKKAAEGHTSAAANLPKILKKVLKKSKSAGRQ